MCIREQAHMTFATSVDPSSKALSDGVIAGKMTDIDSLIAAICVGPNSATLGDDNSLLAAVQAAWPVTAEALYPSTP